MMEMGSLGNSGATCGNKFGSQGLEIQKLGWNPGEKNRV